MLEQPTPPPSLNGSRFHLSFASRHSLCVCWQSGPPPSVVYLCTCMSLAATQSIRVTTHISDNLAAPVLVPCALDTGMGDLLA